MTMNLRLLQKRYPLMTFEKQKQRTILKILFIMIKPFPVRMYVCFFEFPKIFVFATYFIGHYVVLLSLSLNIHFLNNWLIQPSIIFLLYLLTIYCVPSVSDYLSPLLFYYNLSYNHLYTLSTGQCLGCCETLNRTHFF
jgi:hypothetical protein